METYRGFDTDLEVMCVFESPRWEGRWEEECSKLIAVVDGQMVQGRCFVTLVKRTFSKKIINVATRERRLHEEPSLATKLLRTLKIR